MSNGDLLDKKSLTRPNHFYFPTSQVNHEQGCRFGIDRADDTARDFTEFDPNMMLIAAFILTSLN